MCDVCVTAAVPLGRVLIVEDDPVMQTEALEAAAACQATSTALASTRAEAQRLARRETFDMAVVDLGLPDGSGIELIRTFTQEYPAMVCVARTVFDDDERLFGALAAGAQGYLLKGQPRECLHSHLRAAALGDPVVSPAIARKVLSFFRMNPGAALPVDIPSHPLTPREAEVLACVGSGLTIAETAAKLKLSDNTVKTHVKASYSKLNIKSRAGAALEAKRLGLLP